MIQIHRLYLHFILVFILSFNSVFAQDLSLYQEKRIQTSVGELPYRILYPKGYDSTNIEKYPLLLFLHGRGESGDDNQHQLTHGAHLFMKDENRNNFPAIVVFPQCSNDSYWSNVKISLDEKGKRSFHFRKKGKPTVAMKKVLELLKLLLDNSKVDVNKVYVGGLSMGAMGTYEILRRKPKLFAAAFAICGGDLPQNVRKYRRVPLWVFHGEKDDVINAQFSHDIVAQLKKLEVIYKAHFYLNDKHNSWDSAFSEPELLSWLFRFSKK